MKRFILPVLTLSLAFSAFSQPVEFQNWPQGQSPNEIGKKVALNLLSRPAPKATAAHYAEYSTWYKALQFAQITKDEDLKNKLVDRLDYHLTDEGKKQISTNGHVDYRIFGIVPLEVYRINKNPAALEIGKNLADLQFEKEPTTDEQKNLVGLGLSPETRFWIDDMYMLTILQLQAYRATDNSKYLDRAATEMVAYLDKLQQPNGLFYHETNVPFFWGRGDGWVAGGMAEMLYNLPSNHPKRERILAAYQKMMKALLGYQDADGMWHQLIDHPESYAETSSTAMFTFAMVSGVNYGWLKEPEYAIAARNGWIGLQKYIDKDGLVENVCIGTGKQNSLQYYLTRPTQKGDFHGQAPVLWSATALLSAPVPKQP